MLSKCGPCTIRWIKNNKTLQFLEHKCFLTTQAAEKGGNNLPWYRVPCQADYPTISAQSHCSLSPLPNTVLFFHPVLNKKRSTQFANNQQYFQTSPSEYELARGVNWYTTESNNQSHFTHHTMLPTNQVNFTSILYWNING